MAAGELVVVTGGAGYLGSVMVPMLLDAGYRVRIVDRFFFGEEPLAAIRDRIEMIRADTRWCPPSVYEDAHAVIDLASLSNDPAGELDPERTREINFRARVRTATLAKAAGAKRYVLASSCSVYGFQNGIVDEDATPAPITTYAESSLQAEGGVLALGDGTFSVTVLRQGTLYGLSPRMRFDLVVNVMTLDLHRGGVITVRGGEQWRPLIHVADSARAFLTVLAVPREKVAGVVFNVGGTEHNFTVADIAAQVRSTTGSGDIVADKTAVDTRSYRVSFDKIRRVLGFVPEKQPRDGAQEILDALASGAVADSVEKRTIDRYKLLLSREPDILDRKFEFAETLTA
ncbi:MAG TPA: SDR family oxidoreductase [Candidatus Paceibacterota bacterium]|nr:SDR family oxidoreductase [Candidatus Paceibacterota bacterium]